MYLLASSPLAFAARRKGETVGLIGIAVFLTRASCVLLDTIPIRDKVCLRTFTPRRHHVKETRGYRPSAGCTCLLDGPEDGIEQRPFERRSISGERTGSGSTTTTEKAQPSSVIWLAPALLKKPERVR